MNSTQPRQRDPDLALRQAVLERVTVINANLLDRLRTMAEDLAADQHLAALGGLDGIERQIDTMRSLLLLLR